jgi:hypothetical protein
MLPEWVYPLFLLPLAGFIVWFRTQFDYRLTERHLEVILWGISVRRIALKDVEYVTKRHSFFAENWWNTWRPARRRLLVRRRRGLLRNFVVTPRKRYAFKAQLDQAIQRAGGGSPNLVSPPVTDEESGGS